MPEPESFREIGRAGGGSLRVGIGQMGTAGVELRDILVGAGGGETQRYWGWFPPAAARGLAALLNAAADEVDRTRG